MYFSRPYQNRLHRPPMRAGVAFLVAATALYTSHPAHAQTAGLAELMDGPIPILHSSSQGYLGVLVGDVDSDSAAKLKLKEVRGAVVTLIDHDAPAAQAGVHVNDVVVQLNGQAVESAEAFTRMLREIPAGRTVSLVISRDGNLQTMSVELADHKKMEHDVWNRLDNGSDANSSAPAMGILTGGSGTDVPPSGFHMPFFGSTLNVGAMVEPLTSQMADYLGIHGGLMVKQIARKSEAEAAGLKAFDVILKVGTDNISTTADWDRSLRANQNKPVQVTILRDRKQQTLTLQVDSKHHRSELEFENLFDGNCPLMAAVDGDAADVLAQQLAGDDSAIQSMRNQAEALSDQLGNLQFSIDPKEMEELGKQAEQTAKQFREQLRGDDFKIDQKQLDEWKKQAEKLQSPEFQKQLRDQLQKQMEQMQRQFEELQEQGIPHFV